MHYFTADTHFNHGNIMKYCRRTKYMSPEEVEELDAGINFKVDRESINKMNESMIENINNMVKEDDILWHVGDFAFGGHEEIRSKIKCKKINLIFGNHDNHVYDYLFNEVHSLLNANIQKDNKNKRKITFCHYAMAVWQDNSKGAWQLYGHSHTGIESWMDSIIPNRKSIDVGVDNAYKILGDYRPFSFQELEDIFSKKEANNVEPSRP